MALNHSVCDPDLFLLKFYKLIGHSFDNFDAHLVILRLVIVVDDTQILMYGKQHFLHVKLVDKFI